MAYYQMGRIHKKEGNQMKTDGKRTIRKYAALIPAILAYFIIHEGAHMITALFMGTWKGIRFMQMGVQIVTDTNRMTDFQIGLMCIAGPAASLAAGYIMAAVTKKLLAIKSLFLRAVFYYTTLVLLINDTVYLSVIYPYVGGGDMNGITLFFPEVYVRTAFVFLFFINLYFVLKFVTPAYKKAYLLQE